MNVQLTHPILFVMLACLPLSAITGEIETLEAPYYQQNSPTTIEHPISNLLINKMAFDTIYNEFANLIAIAPACEDCSFGRAAATRCEKILSKLQTIASNLQNDTLDTSELDATERLAAGMIYKGISNEAVTLTDKLKVASTSDNSVCLPVAAAILGQVVIVGATSDNEREEICTLDSPVEDEVECLASGCDWCDFYDYRYCTSAEPGTYYCQYFDDPHMCIRAGCQWEEQILYSYCSHDCSRHFVP